MVLFKAIRRRGALSIRCNELLQGIKERGSGVLEALLEAARAIAVTAGPRLRAIEITAFSSGVGVTNFDQLEVFFPIRAFLFERYAAETHFDPARHPVPGDTRVLHVIEVFVSSNGAATERARLDCVEQRLFASGLDACFDEIAHSGR